MKPALFAVVVLALVSRVEGQRSPALEAQQLPTFVTQLGLAHFPAGEAAANDVTDEVLGYQGLVGSVAVLRSGGVVVAGSTSGSLGEKHAPNGYPDAFVARFDRLGNLEWIRQIGPTTAATIPALNGNPSGPGGFAYRYENAADVAVGQDESIYITGTTMSRLGETNGYCGELGCTPDVYLAKFDAHGALQWLRQLGAETAAVSPIDPTNWDSGGALVVDPSGAVIVAGATYGDLGELNGDRESGTDIFLARFSADGQLEWLRQMGALSSPLVGFDPHGGDWPVDIALRPSGAIVVASTTLSFEFPIPQSYVHVLTFDGDGNPLASSRLPGTDEYAGAVATDVTSGRIFIAGKTSASLVEPKGGSSDAFVASYDADLQLEWIRQVGETSATSIGLQNNGSEGVAGICVDAAGDLILAGTTDGAWDEPNGGSSSSDVFTAKLRGADGELLWVSQIGRSTSALHGLSAAGTDFVLGFAPGPRGTLVVTGWTDGNLAETQAGMGDVFVMRLTPKGKL